MKKKHAALPQTPEAFAVVAKLSSKQQVSAVKLFKTPLKKKKKTRLPAACVDSTSVDPCEEGAGPVRAVT